jgi:hydroxybutyrate-dimer hydrolase
MRNFDLIRISVPCVALLLAACAGPVVREDATPTSASRIPMSTTPLHSAAHADLLSAGLGLEGLRALQPPPFADPSAPTAEERRRRALWTNWRGIADLAPGGGFGDVYGSLAPVPGREYHALMRVPGARQPHRVMAQVPDAFDAEHRCLLVTSSSGSRGIYGAIALAGAWGLPRGCAVAYTDKGAGTDYVDLQRPGRIHRLDGGLSDEGDAEAAFDLRGMPASDVPRVAFKHAHSQDNPEADWGRQVRQAAEFGLLALSQARPDEAPFTFANTRVIAASLSNGGGAVLRAAELEGDWLDGVVAIAPNIWPGEGGRALYDYATEAALLMPCALLHPRFDAIPMARPGGARPPAAIARCASLREAGSIDGNDLAAQAADALERLKAGGWTEAALEAGAISVAFDLWRAVAAGYASAYTRRAADAMPCGFAYAAIDVQGRARSPTPEEHAAWWTDAAGIPPGAGVMLLDPQADGPDPGMRGLACLRDLWERDGALAEALRAGVAATRASLPRTDLPIFLVHGADDGLVPEAFTSAPYAAWLQDQGRDVRYWKISHAQHFDAFLGLPPLAARHVPLLPYAFAALDAMWGHVVQRKPLPASAVIEARPRTFEGTALRPLARENLALPGH